MKIEGAKFVYTQAEVDEYSSLWREITTENPRLEVETMRLRDIALLEDEVVLLEHRSPYSQTFQNHDRILSELISAKKPEWNLEKVRQCLRYINSHNGLELEFDFHLATKLAYERRLRNEI